MESDVLTHRKEMESSMESDVLTHRKWEKVGVLEGSLMEIDSTEMHEVFSACGPACRSVTVNGRGQSDQQAKARFSR